MMGLKNNVKKLLIFILLIYILGLTCGLVYLIFLRKLQLGFYSIIRLITCSVIPIGCFFIVQKIDDGFSKLNMKEKVLIIVFICIIFILLLGGLYMFMYENIQQIRSVSSATAILGSSYLINFIDLYIKKMLQHHIGE